MSPSNRHPSPPNRRAKRFRPLPPQLGQARCHSPGTSRRGDGCLPSDVACGLSPSPTATVSLKVLEPFDPLEDFLKLLQLSLLLYGPETRVYELVRHGSGPGE